VRAVLILVVTGWSQSEVRSSVLCSVRHQWLLFPLPSVLNRAQESPSDSLSSASGVPQPQSSVVLGRRNPASIPVRISFPVSIRFWSGLVFRRCLCEAFLSDLFSQLKLSIDGLQNLDFSLQLQDSASRSLLPAVLVSPSALLSDLWPGARNPSLQFDFCLLVLHVLHLLSAVAHSSASGSSV
jgi:hypothetical protein